MDAQDIVALISARARSCIGCSHFCVYTDPVYALNEDGTVFVGQDGAALLTHNVQTFTCMVAEDESEDEGSQNDAADHMLQGGARCPYYSPFDPTSEADTIDDSGVATFRKFGESMNYLVDDDEV